ncbi:5-(carboxyamino)imidazole ribonucleotide synthase [Mycobacterium sp. 852002-40037_SCH5390672]|nr:5-(carboxyamino)imidazole ribonucleotide synthase [Mycobacterium sp. 852002-40037_SCH5390672]OBB97105.1 5-(carboxyamino)imidazole ribonucleotide synthase [Mycobacterium sp. 852002-40037_SCH5390672]
MVGGGQLARMTHQAAIALGQTLRVLATAADEPAALVAPDVVIGSHTEIEDLRRVAAGADVLTFDHEHVPNELLDKLVAEGVNVAPPPQALVHAQDKLVMRRRLDALGVPVPRYAEIGSLDELDAFARRIAGPVVVKAVRGGYDGRGVRMARDPSHAREIAAAFLADGVPVMAEEQVKLRRELSALVARSPFGQGAAWPVVETVQRDGICVQVIAPAPELPREKAAAAQQLALRLAAQLGVVGVLAVELFETAGPSGGELLVNELAMRPHNSGHWTMDGSRTSQFEQHLRAVLDYPLGDTDAIAPLTVMANVLGAANPPRMSVDERLHHLFARMPDARVHLYGKQERPGRKVGHINFVGSGPADRKYVAKLRERAELAAHWLSHGQWSDGWDPHGAGDDAEQSDGEERRK